IEPGVAWRHPPSSAVTNCAMPSLRSIGGYREAFRTLDSRCKAVRRNARSIEYRRTDFGLLLLSFLWLCIGAKQTPEGFTVHRVRSRLRPPLFHQPGPRICGAQSIEALRRHVPLQVVEGVADDLIAAFRVAGIDVIYGGIQRMTAPST